jgi:hypothetical protein
MQRVQIEHVSKMS